VHSSFLHVNQFCKLFLHLTWQNSAIIVILQPSVNLDMLSLNNVGNMSDEEFEETLAVMTNTSTTDTRITPMSSSAKCPPVKKCAGPAVTYTLVNDGEESNNVAPLLPGN